MGYLKFILIIQVLVRSSGSIANERIQYRQKSFIFSLKGDYSSTVKEITVPFHMKCCVTFAK